MAAAGWRSKPCVRSPSRWKARNRHREERGRPKDMERASLALDVAVVLRLGGVSVKTSRTGALAKVLATVLHEIYGSAPEDMFRTIQAVAAFVDRPISEVRRSVEEAAAFRVDGDYCSPVDSAVNTSQNTTNSATNAVIRLRHPLSRGPRDSVPLLTSEVAQILRVFRVDGSGVGRRRQIATVRTRAWRALVRCARGRRSARERGAELERVAHALQQQRERNDPDRPAARSLSARQSAPPV